MGKASHQPAGIRQFFLAILLALFIIIAGIWTLRTWYSANLKPLSSVTATTDFTVRSGETVHQIGDKLQQQHLIKSGKAFETYVRSNELHDKLQAGTYLLNPSMSVQQIVRRMVNGEVAKNLLTILPAKRLDEVMAAFKKAGYSQQEIDQAFKSDNYRDHPALANLPPGATLEGYLYPDSFQKQADTPASSIIRESLNEMSKHLTADIINGFAAQGLNPYQGIILTSIVAQETDNSEYQPTVAQVFYRRLHQNMSLGSDVTAYYASAIAGRPKTVDIDSPYNTRIHTGLPPGPIGNVTANALAATAHPSNTDFLFFVAGDDKKIHFSHTAAEHEAAIKTYCSKQCGQ
jgi:UPF0755 protein